MPIASVDFIHCWGVNANNEIVEEVFILIYNITLTNFYSLFNT